MKFKIDENLPNEAAKLLQEEEHDTETVYDEALQGRSDSEVAQVLQQEGRILVTLDRGFGNLSEYPPHDFPGFLVLRPRWQDKDHVLDLLRRVIPVLSQERLQNHLWIVEEARIRIRLTDSS